MDALRGLYLHLQVALDVGDALEVFGPHPCGGDDHPRADLEFLSGLNQAEPGTGHPVALAQQSYGLEPTCHERPVACRGAQHAQCMARVVDLAVVILHGTDEAPLAKRRGQLVGTASRELAVEGHTGPCAGCPGQQVVQQDPQAHVRALEESMTQRVDEGHRVDEVGRDLEEHGPLVQRLPDEGEVVHLEVAETSVDEFGGAAGGTGGPVLSFHHADSEPPGNGVEGGAGPYDATTDDEDVERLSSKRCQIRGETIWREGDRRDRRGTDHLTNYI